MAPTWLFCPTHIYCLQPFWLCHWMPSCTSPFSCMICACLMPVFASIQLRQSLWHQLLVHYKPVYRQVPDIPTATFDDQWVDHNPTFSTLFLHRLMASLLNLKGIFKNNWKMTQSIAVWEKAQIGCWSWLLLNTWHQASAIITKMDKRLIEDKKDYQINK